MSSELRLMLLIVSVMGFFYIISKIKKSKVRIDDIIFWVFLSIFFIVIAIFPWIAIKLSVLLGFQSAANLVFLSFIGMAFFKLFLVSLSVSALIEKQTLLVQHIALLEKRIKDSSG